jgi:hypothetical protein
MRAVEVLRRFNSLFGHLSKAFFHYFAAWGKNIVIHGLLQLLIQGKYKYA